MDHKILSKKTIAAVKNKPSFCETPLQVAAAIEKEVIHISKKFFSEYNKKLEDFVLFCLLQLGYKGKCEEAEMLKFIINNNIELIYTPARKVNFDMYTIRCKKINYENSIIFKRDNLI